MQCRQGTHQHATSSSEQGLEVGPCEHGTERPGFIQVPDFCSGLRTISFPRRSPCVVSNEETVVLDGLVVSVTVIGHKVSGFKPGRGRWIFKGDNNLQHAFLRRGSKAVGPM
jgi:hypothetical protein